VTPIAAHGKTPGWLLRPPTADAGARLFCFPYSGAGASMYYRWPRRIGSVEVCPIQLPGRETRMREPHYGTYEALASALVEWLPPYLDRPFGFFGHCGGALPAVELARQLHQAGQPTPRRIFVSSQVAPHDGPYGRFLELDAASLADEIARLIVRFGGEPTPALVGMSLELLLKDLEANRRYRPGGPLHLPCGITVIGWTRDDEIPIDMMQGWQAMSADCRFVRLEGEHYEFLAAPSSLLAEIERDFNADAR
jgi:surfactin synthase thioesterase subunit